MWRRLFIILAVLGVALWGSALPVQAGAGVFRAALTTNPPTLDPSMSSSTVTRQIAIYLYETLVTFGENYEVIP
jgi:peptide/nickel transport system substrate-binding protein